MLEANRLVLEDIEPHVDGELIDCKIAGRVVVEEGATLERCTVRGPAVIGAGAGSSTPTSALTPRSRRAARSIARRSSTRSCLPAPASASAVADGGEPARPQRRSRGRRACRRRCGCWSATAPRSPSHEGHGRRRRRHARPGRGRRRPAPWPRRLRDDPAGSRHHRPRFDRPGDRRGPSRGRDQLRRLVRRRRRRGRRARERWRSTTPEPPSGRRRRPGRRERPLPLQRLVFDGTGARPTSRTTCRPDRRLRPLEARRRDLGGGSQPEHFIVRTSWLFGLGGKQLRRDDAADRGEQPEVLVVSDQRGCPTSCTDLAEGMVRLIGTDRYGIHHMVGAGTCTWFDFAARSSTRPTWRRG